MDERAIGVFDSGLGGLTAVKEFINLLPDENIIYFGDTGRVPYGTRSEETIIKYVKQDINFLLKNDVKLIVAACGTASAVALESIKSSYDIPLIGVLEPTCRAALKNSANKRIGIIGTPGTINSGAYGKLIKKYDSSAVTFEKACPMFVPLVENGYLDSEATYIIAREYLAPLIDENIDTLILGCTHYPLLIKVISDIFYEGVKKSKLAPSFAGEDKMPIGIIDAGLCTAHYTKKTLIENDMTAKNRSKGKIRYFVSDNIQNFTNIGKIFLGGEFFTDTRVEKIDIEEY